MELYGIIWHISFEVRNDNVGNIKKRVCLFFKAESIHINIFISCDKHLENEHCVKCNKASHIKTNEFL